MVSMTKSPSKAGHEVAVDATTGQALAIGLDVGNGAEKLYPSLGQVLQESYVLYLEERATFANQGCVEYLAGFPHLGYVPTATEGEESFYFEGFQLEKALFLAVKTEMENGKGKAAIVQEVLECPGRKYKYGCAWSDAFMQKHGER